MPLIRPSADCFAEWVLLVGDYGGPEFPEMVGSGFLAIRRSLTASLLESGGHIGYSIRPSRRREGLAARALADGLVEASAIGLERVLITCDEDNVGSVRTIERYGGVYEGSRGGKRRYWISTLP